MANPTVVHYRDVVKRPAFFTVWERQRHAKAHWLTELFAEMLGVMFYVYCGVGSTVPFTLGNILKIQNISSLQQIGLGYAAGIVFAIVICASTSGGHFNPCISISFVIFKGFPPLKALRYIVAQTLGAYIACLLIYAQYKDLIVAAEEALAAANLLEATLFTPPPTGIAGIFALYLTPGISLGRAFLNEFMTDTMLALVIWGCLDPTNVLVPPPLLPFVIAAAYAAAIWGYAPAGLAANAARDIGGRLAAITIWGTKASGGAYAAIAALTNIPATIFAALLYELFLTDSDRVVPSAHKELIDAHRYHGRAAHPDSESVESDAEKAHVQHGNA